MVTYNNHSNGKFKKLPDKITEKKNLYREKEAINASFPFSKYYPKISSLSGIAKDSYLKELEAEVRGVPTKVYVKGSDITNNDYHGTPDPDNHIPYLI